MISIYAVDSLTEEIRIQMEVEARTFTKYFKNYKFKKDK